MTGDSITPDRPWSRRAGRLVSGTVTVLLAVIVITGLLNGPQGESDRVDSLTAVIKCPQCRGESIKESTAVTARTMREIVTEQVADGRSDDEILDYFRGLYGDQAILDPGLTATTVVLWAVPAMALVGGIGTMIWLKKARERT